MSSGAFMFLLVAVAIASIAGLYGLYANATGTRKCPSCGQRVSNEVMDCQCGYDFRTRSGGEANATAMQATPAAGKVCPDCAETVQAAARVCRYCGYRFDDTERAPET